MSPRHWQPQCLESYWTPKLILQISQYLSFVTMEVTGQIMNLKSRRQLVQRSCGGVLKALQLHLNCIQWWTKLSFYEMERHQLQRNRLRWGKHKSLIMKIGSILLNMLSSWQPQHISVEKLRTWTYGGCSEGWCYHLKHPLSARCRGSACEYETCWEQWSQGPPFWTYAAFPAYSTAPP